jgi:hypothetical protein
LLILFIEWLKLAVIELKDKEKGKRGFGWAPSADSEPQTHGDRGEVLF